MIQTILNIVFGGGFLGLLGLVLYYKPKLREANADARSKEIVNDKQLMDLKTSIMADLQKEINEIMEENIEKTKKIITIENEKAELASENNELKREISTYIKTIENNKKLIESMQKEIKELREEVKQIKNAQ